MVKKTKTDAETPKAEPQEKTPLRTAIERCLGEESTATRLPTTLAVVLTAKGHNESYKKNAPARNRAAAEAEMTVSPNQPKPLI